MTLSKKTKLNKQISNKNKKKHKKEQQTTTKKQ